MLDLACSNDEHYTVTLVEGADDAAAAHLVTGNSMMMIPTAFQFHITVVHSDGTVLDEVTSPREVVHGSSGLKQDTMSCTFGQTETENLPGTGEVTIHVVGTVDAYLPH